MNLEQQRKGLQYIFLIATTILLAASLVDPLYPRQQLLQHIPTVIAILVLAVAAWKRVLSPVSFACIVLFLWLHIVGARYIYSYVPYDRWTELILGTSLSEEFGWERNHYDRLVHLLFGFLAIPPSAEVVQKYGKLSAYWALTFAVLLVLSVSALYEVFEWLLTVVMAPGDAEAYNGQQGDLWDAQKDIILAFGGALLGTTCVVVRRLLLGSP